MKLRPSLLLCLNLTLSACGLSAARPSASLHDFGPPTSGGGAIGIEAPAWLRDERIRYRLLYNDPTQVRFYTLDAWLAPPPALLARQLGGAAGAANIAVRLTLNEFEQRFDSPDSAQIVLGFRAAAESPDGRPLGERQFRYAHPCSSADAKGAVDAYAATVAEASTDLQRWIATLTEQRGGR